tara:strand:+ start:9846 stop:11546 length:1701 start_codon:yes stop_codon:yes gene_type:complete
MYSSANEDEGKYSPTSPEDNERRAEKKKLKEEEAKKKVEEIKHLKIKPSQGLGAGPGLETEPGLDDGNKRDDEREIGLQGGPAGSRGHLLDLATGAKTGTGSAMGTGNSAVRTGEPMDAAWSSLLKASLEDLTQERDRLLESGLRQEAKQFDRVIQQMVRPDQKQQEMLQNIAVPTAQMLMPELEGEDLESMAQEIMHEGRQNPDYIEMQRRMGSHDPQLRQQYMQNVNRMARRMPQFNDARKEAQQSLQNLQATDPSQYFADQQVMTGEPMDNAWSTLLKRDTRGTMEARRRREKRQQFRPSTGQFKKPPGGQSGGVGATMRRFKAHMRGIKGGKKTGLMKPHLSVEMSHRGIATKQPMSKDPQKYRQYMGQQEAQKILGGVRNTYSPHARHSARSFTAGPTGGGRLTGMLPGQSGQMRQPSLQRLRRPRMPRMPRMPTPQMPSMPQMAPPVSSVPSMPAPQSSSMMMSEERTESDLLKSNRHANRTEMLHLMRMLIQAQRAKANMKKSKPNFYDGNVPQHPSPVHSNEDEEEKNDGPTQNLETNSSRLGLDPAGYLSGKRGHMG